MLLGYLNQNKKVNTYFLNFILSVARISVYKTRQIKVFEGKNIDTKRLFIYSMHRYVQYAFTYYKMKNKLNLFNKYFSEKNPLIRFDGSNYKLHI